MSLWGGYSTDRTEYLAHNREISAAAYRLKQESDFSGSWKDRQRRWLMGGSMIRRFRTCCFPGDTGLEAVLVSETRKRWGKILVTAYIFPEIPGRCLWVLGGGCLFLGLGGSIRQSRRRAEPAHGETGIFTAFKKGRVRKRFGQDVSLYGKA